MSTYFLMFLFFCLVSVMGFAASLTHCLVPQERATVLYMTSDLPDMVFRENHLIDLAVSLDYSSKSVTMVCKINGVMINPKNHS